MENKKTYELPTVEITYFPIADILTISDPNSGGGGNSGGGNSGSGNSGNIELPGVNWP